MTKKSTRKPLSRQRRQAKTVRDHLDALEADQKRGAPGRPADSDAVREKTADYEKRIKEEDDPVRRVELIQKRLDSEQHLANLESGHNPDDLKSDFMKAAKEYSELMGITYTAWRELGVPASLFKDAGIPRTRRSSAA